MGSCFMKSKVYYVSCPYCGCCAKLMDSSIIYGRSYGMLWACLPCNAYVGCHSNSPTHKPKGTLANAELREARKRVHAVFDPLWKNGKYTRKQAYQIIADTMGLKLSATHIGMFDLSQCEVAMEAIESVVCPGN